MSYHRNGIEKWCMACGHHKPAAGFEKSATGHEHLCAACIANQKAEMEGKAESDAG